MLVNNYLKKIDKKFIRGKESISIIEKFKFNRLKFQSKMFRTISIYSMLEFNEK